MNLFDTRTVIFSYALSNLICAGVMVILWRQNHKRFAGLGFWLSDFAMQFTALVLVILRGVVPDYLSMTVSNALIIGGTMLLYRGLGEFIGKRNRQIHNFILLIVFIALHAYFVFAIPSLLVRNILFSLGLMAICLQCAWLMLRQVDPGLRPITRGVGQIMIGFCLISFARIIIELCMPSNNDFFHSNTYDTLLLMTYQMLFVILTFSLILMVNRRLFLSMENDIAARQQAENARRESEERYQVFISQSFEAIYRTEFDHPIDISLPVETQIDEIYANAYMAECNQALADMYNLPSVDSLIGTRLIDAHGGSDNPINRAAFRKLIECDYKSLNDETVECDALGNPVWFLSNTIGIVENGHLARLWGTSLNITERKRAEEALRLSEEKFFKAFQSSPDAILITQLDDGKLVEVNEGFTRMVEYTRAEALSSSSLALRLWVNSRDREIVVDELRKNQRVISRELDFRAKSGRILTCLYSAQIIHLSGKAHILSVVRDITESKQIMETLQQREELYRSIFELTQDAIIITTLDGQIVDANPAATKLFGYELEEVRQMQAVDFFVEPQSRTQYIAHMQQHGKIKDNETWLKRKDGKHLLVLGSGAVLHAPGMPPRLLNTLHDITDRHSAEEVVRLRLRLWEYANKHGIEALMQKALDEIGNLINSPIGFYHFVSEDQNTLSLQAWSTRTLAEFCKAEGRGMHYPISEAGVWVECIHQRQPVIHNDYASLPHRKGMPDGHAEVVRELVVPTMRNDRVVSILGVGNKPTNYEQQDVELVEYIADVIWTIVERKRGDEQIHQLNTRLEQLAMTDELTSLANRRSFFMRGSEEIKRAQRYQAPLSLLMLDIDEFKLVNDTYGHDAGDLVLKRVAKTLQDNIREIDLLARLGGEEFGILLPNTKAAEAARLAERLRKAIENEMCTLPDRTISVTVSIGVAKFDGDMTNIDHLLKHADIAMYRAKNQGRNRVVYIEECIEGS